VVGVSTSHTPLTQTEYRWMGRRQSVDQTDNDLLPILRMGADEE
jgi:hypothetical protein